MIRVVVVDDHDLVRTGICLILKGATDIEVVGEGSDGDDALQLSRKLRPDILLMDVNMPRMSGVEATQRLLQYAHPPKVIILTIHADGPIPARLLQVGAAGYLTKGCPAEELLQAVRRVARNERYIGNDIAQKLALSLLPGASRSPFDELSARELEVALRMARGSPVTSIAADLSLSPKTISTYKARVFEKLQVRNAGDLTRVALRHGMIDAPDLES